MKKRELIIGLGGSGSNIVNMFYDKVKDDDNVVSFALDSDEKTKEKLSVELLSLSDVGTLGDVCQKIDVQDLEGWFPIGENFDTSYINGLDMNSGAGGWRIKGFLSFLAGFYNEDFSQKFAEKVKKFIESEDDCEYEVKIISSLVGGTGSALVLPLSLYLKKYIKETYQKDIRISAFLACPDIYSAGLSPEAKKRVYSNAYATVQEINSVNRAIVSARSEKPESHVKLKIGNENGKLGLIFDSQYAEDYVLPMDSIYLFDKCAGESSVTVHESIIADSLYIADDDIFYDNNENDQEPKEDIVKLLSFSEIQFPFNSTAEYIVKSLSTEEIENEWLNLYKSIRQNGHLFINKKLVSERQEDLFADKIVEYTKSQISAFRNGNIGDDFSSVAEIILNRKDANIESYNVTGYDNLINKLYDDVDKQLDKIFLTLEDSHLTELLDIEKLKKIKRIGLFDSKEVKEAKKKDLEARANDILTSLKNQFDAYANFYEKNLNKITNACYGEKNEFSFLSLLDNILMENGKFIHPVIALIKLSVLDKFLCEVVDCGCVNLSKFERLYLENKQVIPSEVFETGRQMDVGRSSYSEFVGNRFYGLALEKLHIEPLSSSEYGEKFIADLKTLKLEKPYFDDLSLISDARKTLVNIKLHCKNLWLYGILGCVRKYIACYMSAFENLQCCTEKLHNEVNDAYVKDSSSSGFFVNVGCSQFQKDEEKRKYLKEVSDKISDFIDKDDYVGEIFYKLFRKKVISQGDVSREDVLSLIEKSDSWHSLEYLNSESYHQYKSMTVIEACLREENAGMLLRVGASARQMVNVSLGENTDKNRGLIGEKFVFVSKNSADYVFNNSDKYFIKAKNEKNAVEDILFKNGVDDSNVVIKGHYPNNKLFAVKEIKNLVFSDIEKFNEKGDYPIYYEAMDFVKNSRRVFLSELYNPYLTHGLNGTTSLTFINEEKQKEYDFNVCKAFLLMLYDEKIKLMLDEEEKQKVFYYLKDGEFLKISFNGCLVNEDNIGTLIDYIASNDDMVLTYSNEFDKNFNTVLMNMPSKDIGVKSCDEIERSINSNKFISFIKKNIFANIKSRKIAPQSLIQFAYNLRENVKESTYGEILAQLADFLVTKICAFKFSKTDEYEYIKLYSNQLSQFIDCLFINLEKEENSLREVKKIFAWLNELGLFKAYDKNNELVDYKISKSNR